MILGYLDKNEKNIDVESQRQQIVQYAAKNNLLIDMFVQEADICSLCSSLETNNHTIIVANVVALGTSLPAIKENISVLAEMCLTVILAKENYVWQSKDLKAISDGLEIVIGIRSSLSSIVTRSALSERKSQGVRLGRRTPNRKRVFDGQEDEIKEKLAEGVTKVQIAKDFGVAQGTLYAFLKQHPELKPEFKGAENA